MMTYSNECIHNKDGIESDLPEPAALQQTERGPQQLQQDVPSVEDLQQADQRSSEHGVQQEHVHVDVQHVSAV